MSDISSLVGKSAQIVELLRPHYQTAEYVRVVLPALLLRRIECLQSDGDPTRLTNSDAITTMIGQNPPVDSILKALQFGPELERLHQHRLVEPVMSVFGAFDLSNEALSNSEAGRLFDEIVTRFGLVTGAEAGEHGTSNDVVALMLGLIAATAADGDPTKPLQVLDPTCGMGQLLVHAGEALVDNSGQYPELFGQELNSWAAGVAQASLLMRGLDPSGIRFGNCLSDDAYPAAKFDHVIAHPPFGLRWKREQETVALEHQTSGERGRFGAGLPRTSDAGLLFVQHAVAKLRTAENGGGTAAVLVNGGPLWAGGSSSGEASIRRRLIEDGLLRAVIALPEQLHRNIAIPTFILFLSTRPDDEPGNVLLVDARGAGETSVEAAGLQTPVASEVGPSINP